MAMLLHDQDMLALTEMLDGMKAFVNCDAFTDADIKDTRIAARAICRVIMRRLQRNGIECADEAEAIDLVEQGLEEIRSLMPA